jgi:hypothetical protein
MIAADPLGNAACWFSRNLRNSAAKFLSPIRRQTLSRRWSYFSCRLAALAAVVAPLLSLGGCAMFHKDFWNMDRYRDERAADIDSRLSKNVPIVKNPF